MRGIWRGKLVGAAENALIRETDPRALVGDRACRALENHSAPYYRAMFSQAGEKIRGEAVSPGHRVNIIQQKAIVICWIELSVTRLSPSDIHRDEVSTTNLYRHAFLLICPFDYLVVDLRISCRTEDRVHFLTALCL